MSIRAAGYCRSNEADLSQQEQIIQSYCEQHSLLLTRIYPDPNTSGLHLRRTGLQAMLSDARDGYFEALVVTDASRLSRRLADLYKIQNILREYRVALYLCYDDRQTAFRSENGDLQAYTSKPPKL